mgnify:FL=1
MARSIDYGNLMHRAMRGLIHDVLKGVERSGLPGAHHFFITFDTRHPGAKLADWLRERYPDEMTVVLQHEYSGLAVTPDGFAVTLSFGSQPEPMYVPLDAVRTFVDPAVEFGLRVDTHDDDEPEAAPSEPDEARKDAEVVSLDKWRK